MVDLGAIRSNIRSLKARLHPNCRFMAVVKADAYGHGMLPVANAAIEAGADWIGVALLEEAVALRKAGVEAPVLVLGEAIPRGAGLFIDNNITATVCSLEAAEALNKAARSRGRNATVHIKVDTGMGRLGLAPEEVLPFVEHVRSLENIDLEGIFSHFAAADEENKEYSFGQLQRFKDIVATLEAHGIEIPMKHFAASAAMIDIPESHLDMVRPGISIYGAYPSPDVDHSVTLKPAMALITAITFLKEVSEGTPLSYGRTFITNRPSRIAVLPVGYGDGYPRLLSNNGEVLVAGKRAPVVGRICMDMTLIDVTDIPEAGVGSEVVLFGSQGEEEVSVDEVAAKAGTISYEILCNITERVPREYMQ